MFRSASLARLVTAAVWVLLLGSTSLGRPDKPTVISTNLTHNIFLVKGHILKLVAQPPPSKDGIAKVLSVALIGLPVGVVKDNSPPYSFVWDTGNVACGHYNLRLVANYTNREIAAFARAKVVLVDRPPVQWVKPGPETVAGEILTCQLQLTSEFRLKQAKLLLDDKPVALLSEPPYQIELDVSSLPKGPHMVRFEAVDRSGFLYNSCPVKVVVPTRILLAAPAGGARIMITGANQAIKLAAQVGPGMAPNRVEFFCDGRKIGEATRPPYELAVSAEEVPSGRHTFSAQVMTEKGHSYSSDGLSVYVRNEVMDAAERERIAQEQLRLAQEQQRAAEEKKERVKEAREELGQKLEKTAQEYAARLFQLHKGYGDQPYLVGRVKGLAVKTGGLLPGGTLDPIICATAAGGGKIELNGRVVDPSTPIAVIEAINYLKYYGTKRYRLPARWYEKNDFGFSFDEKFIPRGGGSAGIAFATAAFSALTGYGVRQDIAMTGDITMDGRVKAIGGVKAKAEAAILARVTTLLLPTANAAETQRLLVAQDMIDIVLVSNMDRVLMHALGKRGPWAHAYTQYHWHLTGGLEYMSQGNWASAAKCFERVVAIEPGDISAQRWLKLTRAPAVK